MGGMFSKPKVNTQAQEESLELQRQSQARQAEALKKQEEQQAKVEAGQAASRRARGGSGRAALLTTGEAGLVPYDPALQKTLG